MSGIEARKYQPLEIGGQAVWSVSSCKPGYGVTQMRDGSTETYWQWVAQHQPRDNHAEHASTGTI